MKKWTIFLLAGCITLSVQAQQFTEARLQATGLTCALCSNAINKALLELPFISTVKSDIKTSSFAIVFKEGSAVDFDQIKQVTPSAAGCEDCLKTGDTWVHLRLCKTCGHVGCCDSSPNKHATGHYRQTQHPIIKSFERGEEWGFCYPDQKYFETI